MMSRKPPKQRARPRHHASQLETALGRIPGARAATVAALGVHKLQTNFTFIFPSNDQYIGASMRLSHQPYEAPLLKDMLSFIRPGDHAVEVGANLGTFTCYFAAAVGRTGSLIAFEPQAKMISYVHANLVLNAVNSGQVEIIHGGVGHAPMVRPAATRSMLSSV